MATPGLGLLLALGLPLLPAGRGQETTETSIITPTPTSTPTPAGGLSAEAITAISVVFSLVAAVLLAVGLFFLVQKLREKRQTEGTYRPSSEEQLNRVSPRLPQAQQPPSSYPFFQFSHAAAEARVPQDSKEPVRGCLPI